MKALETDDEHREYMVKTMCQSYVDSGKDPRDLQLNGAPEKMKLEIEALQKKYIEKHPEISPGIGQNRA